MLILLRRYCGAPIRPLPLHNRQSGTSMIEILVSLFIFTIGMLGLANFQVFAIHQSKAVYQAMIAESEFWQVLEVMDLLQEQHANLPQTVSTNTPQQNCERSFCPAGAFLKYSLGTDQKGGLPDHQLAISLSSEDSSYRVSSSWAAETSVNKSCSPLHSGVRYQTGCYSYVARWLN